LALDCDQESEGSVIALTILDKSIAPSGRILTAVRDPFTNASHANTISVPTARIPASLLEPLIEVAENAEVQESTSLLDGQSVRSGHGRGGDPLIFAVNALLGTKLGVWNALESDRLSYSAELVAIAHGRVPLGADESGGFENIRMINILVTLESGATEFPEKTTSYSHILWTPVETFLKTVVSRDPATIGLDPFEYCVHGLCIATSFAYLKSRFGRPEV